MIKHPHDFMDLLFFSRLVADRTLHKDEFMVELICLKTYIYPLFFALLISACTLPSKVTQGSNRPT